MKKKYAIYFATLVLSAVLQQTWSQSQQHVWYFGNQKIDFTKPLQDIEPELIPEMSNITPQFANDGVHDQQGRMVMNISDDKIYNKFGENIFDLDVSDYSSPENVIIPFPLSTCKYIVLSTYNSMLQDNYTTATIVDLTADNNHGEATSSTVFGVNSGMYRDMVVGKINSNNERIFYILDIKQSIHDDPNLFIQSFKITASGNIINLSSGMVPALHIVNETITDAELSINGDEINIVDGGNNIYRVFPDPNTGLVITSSIYNTYLLGVTSIERAPNGNVFFSFSLGISFTDFINNTNLVGFNIIDQYKLELVFNNYIYAINNQGICHRINDIDNSPTISINIFQNKSIPIINVGIDTQSGLAHIPKQIDGEDYIAKYANGSSAGCCTFDEGINLTDIVISNNTTWSQFNNYVISGVVDITSGTLEINDSEIHFGSSSKIIIRPGAKLIVDHSTLTSTNCGELWRGIELQGDVTEYQDYNEQGELNLTNSTISNAQQGVSVYGLIGTQTDWSKTGGIIKSYNSTFLNNWKDVAFLSYPFANKSEFVKTNFTTSIDLFSNVHPKWHVSMYDVSGVTFKGCQFSNSNPNLVNFNRGSGIKSVDAKYIVTGLCTGPIDPSGQCLNLTRSSFNNLDFGIDATGTNQNQTVNISYTDFNEIIRGIVFTGIANSSIYENTFHMNSTVTSNLNGTLNSPLYLVGIHLISCESHSIENNQLYAQNSNATSHGIIVDNSNLGGTVDACNEIYRNALYDFSYGITANKFNAQIDYENDFNFGRVKGNTGLVFKCNQFYNSQISDITATGPVARKQGTITQNSIDPANNMFSQIPSQQADWWYSPLQYNLRYYYDPSSIPSMRTEPFFTLYNNANTSLQPSNTTFNFENSCPSKKYPFGSTYLISLKDNLADNISHFQDSIDGGNSTLLIQSINNDDPVVIFNSLSQLSGRLSDEVLITLINEVPRIPLGIANDLLVMNAPLTQSVKLVLGASNFPAYYKVQLMSVSGVSAFDLLLQDLTYNKKEIDLVGNELYRKIMADSSILNKMDTLVSLFSNKLNPEELLRFKLEFLISLNSQLSSDSLLQEYNSNYNNQLYATFQALLIEKLNQPGKILAAISDSTVYNSLVNLINSAPESREAQTASKLFEFILNQDVYSEIDEINYVKSMNALTEEISRIVEIPFTVFPNPTTDFISFDLGLIDDDQATVEIYNLNGTQVYNGTFKANNSFLNIEEFKNGVYILKVTYSNGVTAQTQITKI